MVGSTGFFENEPGDRFVEEQHVGVLCEPLGNEHALPLTTRQFGEVTMCEMRDFETFHGAGDRRTVDCSPVSVNWIEATVDPVPTDQRVLVTNHEVYAYFADRYDVDIVELFSESLDAASATVAGIAVVQFFCVLAVTETVAAIQRSRPAPA